MLKKTKIFMWSVASFVVIFSLGHHSAQASTAELVRNGDFEQGNVEWHYDGSLPTPIVNGHGMNGSWHAILGIPQKFDYLSQEPINLPSNASSISFEADIFLLDDTRYTGASAGIIILDYNTREGLAATFYFDQSGAYKIIGDLTPYKGRQIEILIAVQNESSNATTDFDMIMAVDDVSIVATVPDVPLYRFWSENYKGHFYTVSTAERDKIINTDPNWLYEGIVANTITKDFPNAKPVYRFWSDNYKHHFFTASLAEKEKVEANDPNWRYESIAYYAYTSPQTGSTPIYRFWSDAFRGHFYTASAGERDKLINNDPNWKYEGEAWHLPK